MTMPGLLELAMNAARARDDFGQRLREALEASKKDGVRHLQVGDLVEWSVGKRRVRGRVLGGTRDPIEGDGFWVKENGRTKSGKEWPLMFRKIESLLFLGEADPVVAHVYADWLAENRFEEAAAALRQAFPLPQEPRPVPMRGA